MVEISLSGSGEGPGWVIAPSYSTVWFSAMSDNPGFCQVVSHGRGGIGDGSRLYPAPTPERDIAETGNYAKSMARRGRGYLSQLPTAAPMKVATA
jgi:hypothetical protein